MRVDLQVLFGQLVAVLGAPDGGVAQEEALQAGESVHFGGGIEQCLDGGGGAVFFGVGLNCRLAKRERIRLDRDVHAAQIADVLADGQRAVHVRRLIRLVSVLLDQLQRHKAVVLGDQCAGTGLEVLAILIGPPVVELAVAVVLRTLIVEAMADLVADHCADAAVVRRILGLRVEEWGLQNRGREHDDIHAWLVVGVHRLRIHQPFVLVDRLADLGQLIAGLVQVRGLGVLGG